MTVSASADVNRWEYDGDGANKEFPYTSRIFSDSELLVYVDGDIQSSGYSITGEGSTNGGDVVFVTAPALDSKIVIIRNIADQQPTDIPLGGPFPADAIERELDRRTIASQQKSEAISRSIKYLAGDHDLPSADLPTIELMKGKVLAFNINTGAPYGVPLENAPLSNPYITPEDYGAIGDGVTDDANAFVSAFMEAMGSGKLLRGMEHKIYYIGGDLPDITTSFKLSDCHFKAPNQVQIIRANPTWGASKAITSLTTTTINGTTVTRINMASTSGLAEGDWVSVGSSSILWPGETNVRWFESAQIVALASTTVDLHRRLLGEEHGGLSTNLVLFKIPDYTLELRRVKCTADGDPAMSGQTGRRFFMEIRGGINHIIQDCHAYSWWERFIRLSSAINCTVANPSWDFLPDLGTISESFGYGVQEAGACYGNLITGINGGRCRHGYTSGGVAVASYDGLSPWSYGMVGNSVVTSGRVQGASVTSFDTHAGTYNVTFTDLHSTDPTNQEDGGTLPSGFQNRGYRTRLTGCTARGGDTGFRDASALTPWGNAFPAPHLSEYSDIMVSDCDQDAFFLEGANTLQGMLVSVNGFTASRVLNVFQISDDAPYDSRLFVKGALVTEVSGNFILDQSGDANIQVVDCVLRYTGMSDAEPPIHILHVGTGSWAFHDFTVFRRTTGSPDGFILNDDASPAMPVTIGQIVWDLGATFPDLSPESAGTLSTTEMKYRV